MRIAEPSLMFIVAGILQNVTACVRSATQSDKGKTEAAIKCKMEVWLMPITPCVRDS